MELVATSKLKRAQDRVVAARPYAAGAARGHRRPGARRSWPSASRCCAARRRPRKGGPTRAAVILLTSNRGLAGGFNANLIKEARRRIEQLEAEGYTVDLYGIGKKGIGFFRYLGRKLARGAAGHRRQADRRARRRDRGRAADRGLRRGRARRASTWSRPGSSARSQTPPATVRSPPGRGAARRATAARDYILAPSAEAILEQLLPLYVRNAVYRGLVETAAAEHGARRTAMKNATDNAGEILELLKRTYNRQRQAQITQEIAEIVGRRRGAAGVGNTNRR